MASIRIAFALILCASIASGGTISVTSNATLTSANGSAVAGDTVKLAAGTYTVGISPSHAGSSGSPIVYMPVSGAVCSLYVAGYCVEISTNYVIVQDITFKVDPNSVYHPVYMHDCSHSAIINCKSYGGSTQNTLTKGDWNTWRLANLTYCRIIGNIVDRLDANITDDAYRGDGITLTGAGSHFNIIEANLVKNVSHFAFAIPVYTGDGSFNIVRNNKAWNCHGMFGTGDGCRHALYEGNMAWNPGMIDTYQSGPAMEMFGDSTIVRYNMMAHDTTVTPVTLQSGGGWGKFVLAGTELIIEGSTAPDDAEKNGRYYGNAFTGKVTFPGGYGVSDRYKFAFTITDASVSGFGYAFGRTVMKNNIFAYSTDTALVYYQNKYTSYTTMADTFDGNAFWRGTPGGNVVSTQTTSYTGSYSLSTAKANFPSFRSSNLNISPLWVDSTTDGANRSYEISGTSLCKDAGVALTVTSSSAASGQKVINVGDAIYFHYDWGASPYDRGDSVLVGTERIELDSVDYTNRRLIAKTNLGSTVNAGSNVHVLATWNSQTSTYTNRLSGSGPDIGPYEIQQGGVPPVIPGVTTNVSPADGSTQAQPVVFRWHPVSGATTYWLTASYDNWGHDHVSVQTSDTFYTYTGFPLDTTVIWNVAAGNSAGWGAWSDVWTFTTQAAVTYGDTITVNWNNVVESETLTDNTRVLMSNLQRRDNILIVRNPSGKLLAWPSNVRWPGLSAPPQPAAGDTAMYWLVRDGSIVSGYDLSRVGQVSSGVTAGWVTAQLAAYLKYTSPLSPPSDPSDTGTAGEFRYDSGYIYFCTATNTWVRWSVSGSW